MKTGGSSVIVANMANHILREYRAGRMTTNDDINTYLGDQGFRDFTALRTALTVIDAPQALLNLIPLGGGKKSRRKSHKRKSKRKRKSRM